MRASLEIEGAIDVVFNYLGQVAGVQDGAGILVDDITQTEGPLSVARESSGLGRALENHRSIGLEFNALIHGGVLNATFSCSAKHDQQNSLQKLADSFIDVLKAIIAHCLRVQSKGYTSSNFLLAPLEQPEIDLL